MDDTIVGIDLGSYYARCAAVINDTVAVIKINDERKSQCIFSERNGIHSTGNRAMKTAPNNVIFDACRSQREKNYSETWCFAKLENENYKFGDTKYAPTKIIPQKDAIAAILETIKIAVEKRLQKNINKAVITVPDSADQYHRLLIIEAATQAQFNVVNLITQNAAAATTFVLNKSNPAPSLLMIFNFGASQLNISIYKCREKTAGLIDVSGNECLGGEDFTNRIAEKLLCYVKEDRGNNYIANGKALKNIREAAEKVLIDLSMMRETRCVFEVDEQDYTINVTQEDIKKLCADFYQQIEKYIQIISKKFEACDITDIVMIGGSSRIHGVEEIVQKYFYKAKFDTTLVPEEATVCGAAIKGAILGKSFSIEINVNNNAAHSIYCQTEFAKIDIINVHEKLPSSIRRFSFPKMTPKIEFFEDDLTVKSLGAIENVVEHAKFACFVDNNGLLKCYIEDKKRELKTSLDQISSKNDYINPTLHPNNFEEKQLYQLKDESLSPTPATTLRTPYGRYSGNSQKSKSAEQVQRNTADMTPIQNIGTHHSESNRTLPTSFSTIGHNSNFVCQQKSKEELQRSFNDGNSTYSNTAHSYPYTNFDSKYYSVYKPQQTLNYQQRNLNKQKEYESSQEKRNSINKISDNNTNKDYAQPSSNSSSKADEINRTGKNKETKNRKKYF